MKKVSFRVRRIYYDQFANGTKHEELRALKLYWLKILRPIIPKKFITHPLIRQWISSKKPKGLQPKIAVIHTSGQPTLCFKIVATWVDEPERILGRPLSEQGKEDIPTELCIVTRIGERIE